MGIPVSFVVYFDIKKEEFATKYKAKNELSEISEED
jgi:hypothetical protein